MITQGILRTLLNAVTSVSSGVAQVSKETFKTFVGTVAGTGAVTATVKVEVSHDGTKWVTLGTITLTGTTTVSDGFSCENAWPFVRGNITAISGTGAAVTLTMSQ